MQNMWTESSLGVSWDVSEQLGHALRMFLMSKVKSMAFINTVLIVSYITEYIRGRKKTIR